VRARADHAVAEHEGAKRELALLALHGKLLVRVRVRARARVRVRVRVRVRINQGYPSPNPKPNPNPNPDPNPNPNGELLRVAAGVDEAEPRK
jgi:hypothetical protein